MEPQRARPCSPVSLAAAEIQGRWNGVADSAVSVSLRPVPPSAAVELHAGSRVVDGGAHAVGDASGAGWGAGVAAEGGRAHSPTPLPADPASDPGALPCLCSNNSTEARSALGLTAQQKKSACALAWNVQALAERHGLGRLGFLTLTFADHVLDPKESQRRLNSLATHVLRERYPQGYVRVLERQKSGRIHYHLLLVLPFEAREGVDFEAFARNDYRTASAELRSEWAFWRRTARAYGFGRTELMPVRSTEEGIGRYVGKYIGKHHASRKPDDKGIRLVEYSRGARMAVTRFAWCTDNAAEWRAKVRLFAQIMSHRIGTNLVGIEDISQHLGGRWAYNYREFIYSLPVVTPPVGKGLLTDGRAYDVRTGELHT